MLYVDGALLLGGLFSVVSGVGSLNGGPENQVTLLQLLVNFILGGFAVLMLIKYAPKKGESKGWLKYILTTFGIMFFWVMLFILMFAVIPESVNPTIPSQAVIGIGLVSLAVKWYLKKKLDIRGTMF